MVIPKFGFLKRTDFNLLKSFKIKKYLKEKINGAYHIGGNKEISIYEFALKYFKEKNLSTNLIKRINPNKSKTIYNGNLSS